MASGDNNSAERACPACGRRQATSRGCKNDFRLVACESCATLYTATLPNSGESQDYDSYYTAENLTVPAFINQRLDEIVATFERYRKTNRLLDVGCGGGSFLEAAARNRWQALGVEVSRTASEHVRGRGIEVFCGFLEQANYPDDHFDVVIASEVLEHVPDPGAMLEEIARVLRPGGLLWATTPHGRGISARLLGLEWSNVCPPEHLQLFSRAGMSRLLTGAGFSQVELATHGTNPFEILHSLRRRPTPAAENIAGESVPAANFNRVESSYELNAFLSDSSFRSFLKRTLNGVLNVARMGDSLKIRAEK
jgi:SAM-dependent methyltransferase